MFGRCVQRTVSSYYKQQMRISKAGDTHDVIEDPDACFATAQGLGEGPSKSSSDDGQGNSEISYVITLMLREFTHSIAALRVRYQVIPEVS